MKSKNFRPCYVNPLIPKCRWCSSGQSRWMVEKNRRKYSLYILYRSIIYHCYRSKSLYPMSGSPQRGAVDCSELVNPTFDPPENGFWIQCSDQHEDAINIQIEKFSAKTLGISPVNVSSFNDASRTIAKTEHAEEETSRMRASLGAYQNRLEHSYNSDRNKEENTQAAESRIRDTDMAKEMVNNSKLSILGQTGEAMIVQANRSKDSILSLLQ